MKNATASNYWHEVSTLARLSATRPRKERDANATKSTSTTNNNLFMGQRVSIGFAFTTGQLQGYHSNTKLSSGVIWSTSVVHLSNRPSDPRRYYVSSERSRCTAWRVECNLLAFAVWGPIGAPSWAHYGSWAYMGPNGLMWANAAHVSPYGPIWPTRPHMGPSCALWGPKLGPMRGPSFGPSRAHWGPKPQQQQQQQQPNTFVCRVKTVV